MVTWTLLRNYFSWKGMLTKKNERNVNNNFTGEILFIAQLLKLILLPNSLKPT